MGLLRALAVVDLVECTRSEWHVASIGNDV
jgi:hypothetical protein